MRRLVAAIGLAIAVLLVVGCSDSGSSDSANGSSPAVTVNSTKISTDQMVDELSELAGNERLVKWYQDQDFKLVPRDDTIGPDTAAFWVNTLTQKTFIDREFARRPEVGAGRPVAVGRIEDRAH